MAEDGERELMAGDKCPECGRALVWKQLGKHALPVLRCTRFPKCQWGVGLDPEPEPEPPPKPEVSRVEATPPPPPADVMDDAELRERVNEMPVKDFAAVMAAGQRLAIIGLVKVLGSQESIDRDVVAAAREFFRIVPPPENLGAMLKEVGPASATDAWREGLDKALKGETEDA